MRCEQKPECGAKVYVALSVEETAVIIDVGITRVEDASAKRGYRIKGDVAFDEAAPQTSYITPVPGGVGLMTIAGLLKNTLAAYKKRAFYYSNALSENRQCVLKRIAD